MPSSELPPARRAPGSRARGLSAGAYALLCAVPLLAGWPLRGVCAEANWLDVESRIQYGYFTEDARSIRGVMDTLGPAESPDPARNYYAGLANYRLTLLLAGSDKGHAKEAAEHCVASLDRALQARQDFADALALQSACLEQLASLEPWRSPLAASRSGTQLEKARHAEPRNPRVLFLNAVEDYARPAANPADKDRALGEFRKAADAFEAERQNEDHIPGWGAAEVYVYLARCYLDRRSTLQARDALERALLIAPEFAQARRLMSKITSG